MSELQTRKTLIEKIRDQHDERSWEDFVHYYSGYIYVIIRNMNLSHHETEDLMQQVLLKAWKGIPGMNYSPDKHRFRSWLCTVTKNTARTYLTKRSKTEKIYDESGTDVEEGAIMPAIDDIAEQEWEIYIANLAMEEVRSRFQEGVIKHLSCLQRAMGPRRLPKKCNCQSILYTYIKNVFKMHFIKKSFDWITTWDRKWISAHSIIFIKGMTRGLATS